MEEYDDYYYYLDVVSGLEFITCTSFQANQDGWYAEIFNTQPSIRFTKFGELQGLLNQLESRIVKK